MTEDDKVKAALAEAHQLLVYNHQHLITSDAPRTPYGECAWRVWHLQDDARDHMTTAERGLYDALMRLDPLEILENE